MSTGVPATVAVATHGVRRRTDTRTRVVRTFLITFGTWSLFLCYLLASA
jgi:hypothetical protein